MMILPGNTNNLESEIWQMRLPNCLSGCIIFWHMQVAELKSETVFRLFKNLTRSNYKRLAMGYYDDFKIALDNAHSERQIGEYLKQNDWPTKEEKRRKLGERRARLRALREDVVIHPSDVRPGDVIEIRKVRPRKRRDRSACKWRVQYDDSGNGYMILAQEGNYYKEWADK